ncbi:hypothetical protein PMI36_05340 [Pseudomonas sp. GM79]|nr:hypothetical protein PMI36_05340 [Pseudomonas sp. GM79]
MMYKRVTGVFCLLLSGCSLYPHTKSDLLSTGTASPEYCLAQDRGQVEERVQNYLNHCFHAKNIALPNGAYIVESTKLELNKTAEKTDMVLFGPTIYGDQYYLNIVVSGKNPACKTTMTAVAANWVFKRNFEKLVESANGGDPWCPL